MKILKIEEYRSFSEFNDAEIGKIHELVVEEFSKRSENLITVEAVSDIFLLDAVSEQKFKKEQLGSQALWIKITYTKIEGHLVRKITRDLWTGSFKECCRPGDEVDDEIVDHFLNCLPPRRCTSDYLQVGEQSDSTDDGWPTYDTFQKRGGKWFYLGDCILNGTEHRKDTYGARRRKEI